MTIAKSTVISKIKRRLNEDPWHDICTEAMDATEAGLDVADTTKWSVGDVVEFQDDGEQCLVTALATGTSLTVIRGVNGTTAATHSILADVVKNPTFQYVQITQTISGVIHDLWPYVYKKVTAALTPVTTGERYYSVAATIMDLSSAVQMTNSTPDQPRLYGGRRNPYTIALVQGLPDNFPDTEDTGKAVCIPNLYNATKTILVNGIGRVTDAETTPGTYDDFSAGVETECVVCFAVEELLAGSDINRMTGTDVSMNDQSVTPGRRSQIAVEVWHRKGLRHRGQWAEDLRNTLPKLESFERR